VAYDNLARWRRDTGSTAPQLVPGAPNLSVEQLYRITEKQVRTVGLLASRLSGCHTPHVQLSTTQLHFNHELRGRHSCVTAMALQEQDLLEGTSTWGRMPPRAPQQGYDGRSSATGALPSTLQPRGSANSKLYTRSASQAASSGSGGGVDAFAQRPENAAFAGVAADAMARVRARFLGFADGQDTAVSVIRGLLASFSLSPVPSAHDRVGLK
jgi:hypothetical protein